MIAVGNRVRLGGGFAERSATVLAIDGERVTVQTDEGIRRTVSRSRCWPIAQTSHRNVLTSQPSYGAELAAVPKAGSYEDPAYVAWVRSLPCAWCSVRGETEPHHYPERSRGGRDHDVVPLCATHHREFHDRGTIGRMVPVQTRAWLVERKAELLSRRLREVSDGE
jgi:hypothetical protein